MIAIPGGLQKSGPSLKKAAKVWEREDEIDDM